MSEYKLKENLSFFDDLNMTTDRLQSLYEKNPEEAKSVTKSMIGQLEFIISSNLPDPQSIINEAYQKAKDRSEFWYEDARRLESKAESESDPDEKERLAKSAALSNDTAQWMEINMTYINLKEAVERAKINGYLIKEKKFD